VESAVDGVAQWKSENKIQEKSNDGSVSNPPYTARNPQFQFFIGSEKALCSMKCKFEVGALRIFFS
jgi:hypothetical protein